MTDPEPAHNDHALPANDGGPSRRPGAWRAFLLPLILLVVAALGVAANLALPIFSFLRPDGGVAYATWSQISGPRSLGYEQRLAVFPMLGSGLAAAAGILLYVETLAGRRRPLPLLRPLACGLVAGAGFLLALTGTRWLGFYVARRLQESDALIHLEAAPAANLGTGILLLAASSWAAVVWIRRNGLWPPPAPWILVSAASGAAGLLAMPLLPFATTRVWGGTTAYLDELTMAALAAQSPGGLQAAHLLGWVRVAIWTSTVIAITGFLFAAARRRWPRQGWLAWASRVWLLCAPTILAGMFLAAAFYVRLPNLREQTAPWPNPFLALTLASSAAAWLLHAVPVLRRAYWERRSKVSAIQD